MQNRSPVLYGLSYLILTLLLMSVNSAAAQTRYDFKAMPCWRIENPDTMDLILTGLMLPKENPQAIEIVDINNNGIDELDILIVSPEGRTQSDEIQEQGYYQTYVLGELDIPPSVREIINNIDMGRKAEQSITVASLEDALRLWSKMKTAKASIAVTTLTGLLQNYDETDYTFVVQRKANGMFVFRMIGFDEQKTTPSTPWDPAADLPETNLTNMNVAEVLRAFFKKLESQIQQDAIIIHRTRRDTVWVNKR